MRAVTDYLAFEHHRDLTERPHRLLPRTLVSTFGINAKHSSLLRRVHHHHPQPAASLATLADAQVRPPSLFPYARQPRRPSHPPLPVSVFAFQLLLRQVSVYGQPDWLATGIYLTAHFGQCVTDHGRLECLKWDASTWHEARLSSTAVYVQVTFKPLAVTPWKMKGPVPSPASEPPAST